MATSLQRLHQHRLPRVGRNGDGGPVDVIVPARNESERIRECVTALSRSRCRMSVTVVDDGSDDGTAAVARAAGAGVMATPGPPPGWLGKPHACHLGAQGAKAEWLAFVDADVTLAPHTLPALVRYCEETGVAAASPLLRQRCSRLADRLLVPAAYWQYLVGLPGAAGRRTRLGPRAILNGQCIVLRRSAYLSAGGHAHPHVRASVIEDSALARRLVETGHRVSLVNGDDMGTVRMYDGLASVRAGFGKNLAAFVLADPPRGLLVAVAGMATSTVPWLALPAIRSRSTRAAVGAAIAYVAGCAALAGAYRAADESRLLTLWHPLTSMGVQAIALESLARTLSRRRLPWRGRSLD